MDTGFKAKAGNGAGHPEESGGTLLPMLIGGLVLIVIGAICVMAFV